MDVVSLHPFADSIIANAVFFAYGQYRLCTQIFKQLIF